MSSTQQLEGASAPFYHRRGNLDGRPWTTEEKAKLRRLMEQKIPFKIIAYELDRTVVSLRAKSVRMRREDPTWPTYHAEAEVRKPVTIRLEAAVLRLAHRRAHARHTSLSAYIRYLILRDN